MGVPYIYNTKKSLYKQFIVLECTINSVQVFDFSFHFQDNDIVKVLERCQICENLRNVIMSSLTYRLLFLNCFISLAV
jgi:hypothetical protein